MTIEHNGGLFTSKQLSLGSLYRPVCETQHLALFLSWFPWDWGTSLALTPPSPAIDYRQNPVHSRKEFTCNLLEFPLELATGISTPYNCIAHPNGFHGVYSVEPNARCCHNYPSSEKIIVLCMKKRPMLLCILILDYTITWKRFRGLCVCKNDGMTLITLKKFRMTLTALSRS